MFNIDTDTSKYASLVVTHECNKKCAFCIDRYRGRAEYISIPQVEAAVQVFIDNGIKDVLIVGGEPTLHPNIVDICKIIKKAGFNSILTSNFSFPEVVFKLDGIVDNFNISYYRQRMLPRQRELISDLTISALIHADQLNCKSNLDLFIDAFSNSAHLKFSTLSICNEYTRKNQYVEYLDSLPGEKVVLFNEIEGIVYRNCVIKRYDRVVNNNSHQSLKFHVDGEVSRSWQRTGPSLATVNQAEKRQ